VRPATDDDRDAVLALGVTEEAAWFGVPETSADEVGEWIDDEGGIATGVIALDGDRIGGFASPGRHEAVLLADPAADGVVDELLAWLAEQREALELRTFGGDERRVAAFERHGLRHARSSFTLARADEAGPLPGAELPAGIEVAAYRLGEDDEAVHRLIYVDAAWASVAGHTERDLDRWREATGQCPLLLLARRDGAPAGFASGRILDSGRGYVHMLAVAASERGRGLGRALLVQAFGELQRAGARDLTLDVEAANEAALGLYRSVGLEVEREWRVYAT
jgi:ribosomal protein S18 acetylase RimI-like enzyme